MSTPQRPGKTAGLRHVALNVADVAACERFYVELVGMSVEWRPDSDNVYLSSGNDNLALHRKAEDTTAQPEAAQRLDHMGFILNTIEQVDQWYEFLNSHAVPVIAPPKTHRDGARSFYVSDPDGTVVQFIYHPPLTN